MKKPHRKKTINDLSERSKQLNTIIRTAALTVDPYGSISVLAEKAEVSAESIRKAIRNGRFSVGLASALEIALGRDVLSKEVLRPEKISA